MDRIPTCLKNEGAISFAALNSASGFVSYFGELFSADRLNRLVILKGGPGTGKSTLLFRAAEYAKGKGESVEYYLCSSDESSLDAVLFKESGLAIVDGTAPHTMEAHYPRAFEELFDTASFLNGEALRARRMEIVELCERKKVHYSRAYRLLKTAGDLYAQANLRLSDGVQKEKLYSAVQRQAKRLGLMNEKGGVVRRQITAFGGSGRVSLLSFCRDGYRSFRIGDFFGHGALYLKCLLDLAKENGARAEYSCAPLSPLNLDAVCFPAARVCFYIGEEEDGGEGINFLRFMSSDVLRENRNRLRFFRQTIDSLLIGSRENFESARQTHALLESVYSPAMDFGALSAVWTARLKDWL